ncbi:MAG: chromate efflux transporter [Lysobacteraceae bacterium]|nr:MAG: chromate efflux transporter [Xanthomonadaceae bacterium]
MTDAPAPTVSFRQAFRVWWRIGWLSFGGPAGQIALMHRELVEQRRWISEPRFLHALNYCMLLPGPEAQQLAVYIGWLMHRVRGGLVAGLLFVLPGFVSILLLSVLYVRYGATPVATAIFFGLKAAVLAVVVEAVLRIGRRALKTRFLLAVSGAAFLGIHVLAVPFPAIVAAAALAGLLVRLARPQWLPQPKADEAHDDAHYLVDAALAAGLLPHTQPSRSRVLRTTLVSLALWTVPVLLVAAWLGTQHVLAREGLFFGKAAIVTFGGAYAVLAYVAQRAVEELHWLQPGEMVDGLALAETTPGPLIMVLQFVGFVAAYRHAGPLDPWLAATLGALLTTWVTFVPSFFFIFAGAPYVEALRRNRALHGALSAITAAVVGVVLNLSVWFALHTLFGQTRTLRSGMVQMDVPVLATYEPFAIALSALAIYLTLRRHWPILWTLALCGVLGGVYRAAYGAPA